VHPAGGAFAPFADGDFSVLPTSISGYSFPAEEVRYRTVGRCTVLRGGRSLVLYPMRLLNCSAAQPPVQIVTRNLSMVRGRAGNRNDISSAFCQPSFSNP
jgi:hypothetical protein